MNNLEKEAEQYTKCKQLDSNYIYDKISCYESFIAGANSNYAKQQVIKNRIEGSIEGLYQLHKENRLNVDMSIICLKKIEILQSELKQLKTSKI